jgi:FkbM family methyltransferase
MATIKRRIADALGRALDVTIVPRGKLALLFEKEHLSRFFAKFEVDCVFDVGANEGQYARMLREIGYGGRIISFEPIPEAASHLRGLALNDPYWTVEEVALDETERRTTFNIMQSSEFSSLKTPSHANTTNFTKENAVARAIDVQTGRLEAFFKRYRAEFRFGRPFLKMDTQGNDLAVARGAGNHLTDFVGIQSELAVKRIYSDADDYRAALDFYKAAGFELSAFVPNNLGHFPVLIEIDCILFNPKAA